MQPAEVGEADRHGGSRCPPLRRPRGEYTTAIEAAAKTSPATRRRRTALPNDDRTDDELETSRVTADNPTVMTIAVPTISSERRGWKCLEEIGQSLRRHRVKAT